MLRRVAQGAQGEKRLVARAGAGGKGPIAVGEVKNAIASLTSSRLKQKALKGSIRLTENSGQW
jgi:hypothetical protein